MVIGSGPWRRLGVVEFSVLRGGKNKTVSVEGIRVKADAEITVTDVQQGLGSFMQMQEPSMAQELLRQHGTSVIPNGQGVRIMLLTEGVMVHG